MKNRTKRPGRTLAALLVALALLCTGGLSVLAEGDTAGEGTSLAGTSLAGEVPPQAPLAAGPAQEGAPAAEGLETFTIAVYYQYADYTVAAQPYVATVQPGYALVETVPSPAIPGYTPDRASVTLNVPSASADLIEIVTYIANGDTPYTVVHELEELDGSYTAFLTQNLMGATGAEVTASAQAREGFTPAAPPTAEIAADGSTELVLRYTRNTHVVYYNTADGQYIAPYSVQYGAPLQPLPDTAARAGYEFLAWDTALPATMPDNDVTFTALWKTDGEVSYLVHYWLENADDDAYTWVGTAVLSAEAGTTPTPPADESGVQFPIDAVHYERNDALTGASFAGAIISGDGESELNVYYDRVKYTIWFNPDHYYYAAEANWQRNVGLLIDGVEYWSGRDFTGVPSTQKPKYWDGVDKDLLYSITAKYGADITAQWPQVGDFIGYDAVQAAGSFFYGWCYRVGSTTYGRRLSTHYMDDWVLDCHAKNEGVLIPNFVVNSLSPRAVQLNYYVENLDESGYELVRELPWQAMGTGVNSYTTPSISGYTFEWGEGVETGNDVTQADGSIFLEPASESFNVYFSRNTYTLTMVNGNLTYAQAQLKTGAPLDEYFEDDPERPSGIAADYTFEGWYTTVSCLDGSEYAPAQFTLPVGGLTLYAKWQAPSYTVTFQPENGEAGTEQRVEKNKLATRPADPTRPGYTFAGWYVPSESIRYQFNFPVTADIILEARWTPSTGIAYTVAHNELDAGGAHIGQLVPDYTGYAAMLQTVTQTAEVVPGYLPDVRSQSITMAASGNQIVFNYRPFTSVAYTVRYREVGTDAVLAADETITTPDAVVTEQFLHIGGYTPVQLQQTLALVQNPADNVITFYYYPAGSVQFTVEHYQQTLSGTYTLVATDTGSGAAGAVVSGTPRSYTHFAYNAAISTESDVLSAGLVLRLYYDRNLYSVRFLPGANGSLSGVATFAGIPYGTALSAAVAIPVPVANSGYEFAGWSPALGSTVNGNLVYTAQWRATGGPGPDPSSSSSGSGGGGSSSAPRSSSSTPGSSSSGGGGETTSERVAPGSSSQVASQVPASSSQGGDADQERLMRETGSLTIFGVEIPRGSFAVRGSWSLLSLLLAIVCLALAAVLAVLTLVRKALHGRVLRLVAAACGVLPGLAFLVLDSLGGTMAFLTRSTPWVLALAVAHLLLSVLALARRKEPAEPDTEK